MRAYSMDLRERVLHDSDAGMQAAAVASKYRVSASWVRRLKQRRRETGEVAPRQQRYGRHPVLASQLHTLAALIREQPDLWVANYYSARNPLRLSSLVILGVVARMFRCATDHPAGAPDRHPGPADGPRRPAVCRG